MNLQTTYTMCTGAHWPAILSATLMFLSRADENNQCKLSCLFHTGSKKMWFFSSSIPVLIFRTMQFIGIIAWTAWPTYIYQISIFNQATYTYCDLNLSTMWKLKELNWMLNWLFTSHLEQFSIRCWATKMLNISMWDKSLVFYFSFRTEIWGIEIWENPK